MTESEPIHVLIADDHDMLREGLAAFLRAYGDLRLVGEAANGHEAVRMCHELRPDVVLIDLVMPGMDGVTAIQVIHEKQPDVQLIVLSTFSDEKLVKSALRAGAIGYLLKNVSASRLAEAIRAAHAGLPILSPEISRTIVGPGDDLQIPVGNRLTQRETEVLGLMVAGLSNAEIAQRLTISTYTVKNHVSGILVKMGVSNRTEAVSKALRQ
jgi:NarL family two-component system response regulator LiaR